MSYSVLLAARNEEASIGFALEALCKQSIEPSQILVGVNDSSDRTAEIARSYSGVSVFEYEEAGKARTLNKLLEHVDSEHLVFTDADVIVFPRACERIHSKLDSGKPGVGISSIEVSINSQSYCFPMFRGGLCGVNYPLLSAFAQSKGVDLFPDTIVVEDTFMLYLIKSGGVNPSLENLPGYVLSSEMSIKSYLSRELRFAKSAIQLHKDFPQLKPSLLQKQQNISNYVHKFYDRIKYSDEPFPNNIISTTKFASSILYKKILRKVISYLPQYEIDGSWQSPERNPELLKAALQDPRIQKYF